MGLDPNDIHLRIEADVSAPGAEQAAQQIRGAGQAADQTRASFDRLRQTGGQPGAQQVVAAPPVNPANTGRDPEIANQLVRALVQQRQATEEVFRNAVASVRASTGVRPTITPQELGISVSPATQALNEAERRQANQAAQQRAERDARLQGNAFSNIRTGQLVAPIRGQDTFGDAGNGAGQVRQEVEGLDEPLQRAQRGASGLAGIFNLSGQSLTRASLALVGVGAGLNALVTIANRVHTEIVSAVDAQVQLAERSRELAADYGQQGGGQFAARAAAFTANPQTRGSEQDYLAAAASLHQLTAEYGLNNDQVDRLTTAAGQLARVHNTELAPAVQALQGVLRGNVDAAQAYGISLTDEYGRIGGIGATYDQLVATVGRARAEQILYAQVLQQTSQQQQNAAGAIGTTAAALDRLQKVAATAHQSLVDLAAKPFDVVVNYLAATNALQDVGKTTTQIAAEQRHPIGQAPNLGVQSVAAQLPQPQLPERAPQSQFVTEQLPGPTGPALTAPGQDQTRRDLGIRRVAVTPPPAPGALDFSATTGPTPAIDAAARAQTGLADASKQAADAAGAELSAFERLSTHLQGDLLPTIQRLSSTQQAISQLGTLAQALQGPDQLTGGDIGRRAATQAAQDVLAQQRLRDAQRADAQIQEAGQVDPQEFARRTAARRAELEGQQAQTFAGRAQQEAQAGVSALDLVDQQRQLDAAGQLASLRTETLNREGSIVDLQRQEADLADQMRVTNRENLDLLERQTQARLDAVGASNRLNDVQFATQRDQLEIQATRADVRRGALDPSALQDIPAIRQRLRAEMLATPRAQLDALTAGRPAELAGRDVQQDQLRRALASVPEQRQQRGLEDRLTPLQQEQRATDERTQALNRQLEIARLAEEPQRAAAERNVLAATAVALAADQSVRSAQEWAAGIHDGLTDLERAWGISQGLVQSGPNPTPHRQPGAGGGDSAGGNTYITINVTNANASAQDIGNQVLAALTRRGQRAPRAAPSSLVGAR